MSLRSALRQCKYALAPAVEACWRPVIGALSRPRRAPEAWASPGNQRVLVVAPHPDDEAIGCVGAVLRHVAAGDSVRIAVATDGRRSRTVAGPDAMARVRRAECESAARIMGIARLEWLGLPEGEWAPVRLAGLLAEVLADLRPEVVYAPSRVDFHPEHFAVAHSLALALAAGHVPGCLVRVYQVQVPLTATLTNLVLDTSALRERCEQVFHAYASQLGSVRCAPRLRRYAARSAARWLEPYWQMPAERYVELHRNPPPGWPPAFRGLRSFPLSDPLAWLAGRAERRRLAAQLD